MQKTTSHGLSHYRSVGAYGAAAAEDRTQLIARLMEAAIDRIHMARGHMERKEVARKGETLQRAIGIIDGLRASLDHEQGRDLSANLEALYDYMTRRLVEANMMDDTGRLDEVAHLMGELKAGWDEIPPDAISMIEAPTAQTHP